MKNVLDGGEAIVQAFRDLDVDYVMASPGSEWGAVWEAFARQTVNKVKGPTYLSCWHETLAANLAVGYTWATGRMQVVMLHAGVGLMQGSMGIHGARLARVPMVVMSGESLTFGDQDGFDPGAQWYTSLAIRGGPQNIMEPYCKWSNQATSPATLYEHVIRAGELAQRAPTGPTYLNVPIETMLHPWAPPAKLRKVPAPPKHQVAASDIEKVAELLIQAKNPVITTEGIGRDPAGYRALVALAETLAIPVVEGSVADFANFPKDHPLHQGFAIRPFLDKADVVVLVRSRVPWYPPSKGPKDATVVVIDEAPFHDYMVYQSLQGNVFLEGDVPSTLSALCEAIKASGVSAAKVKGRLAEWSAAHDKLQEELRASRAKARSGKAIHPITLCEALGKAMPDNAVYVDETTTHRGMNQRHVDYKGMQSYYRVPSGLGQGLGTALGVKLADRSRPVVSLIGDGAFLYNPVPQSLGLAKNADLPILIVVYNNDGYAAMRNNQSSYYPDGTGVQHQIFPGHTINGPAYDELVQPFGGVGIKIDDPAELEAGLKKGLKAVENGKTAIVNVTLSP